MNLRPSMASSSVVTVANSPFLKSNLRFGPSRLPKERPLRFEGIPIVKEALQTAKEAFNAAQRASDAQVRSPKDESSSKAQLAACGLGLVASRFSDR